MSDYPGPGPDLPTGPSGPPPGRNRVLAIAVFVLAVGLVSVVVVAVLIGVLAATTSHSSSSSASSSSTPTGSDTTAATPTDSPAGPGTPVVTVTAAASGTTITNAATGVSVTLPSSWLGADLGGGPDAAGHQIYPDDPSEAKFVSQLVTNLPASTLLFGFDPSEATNQAKFSSSFSAIQDSSVPAGDTLQQAADAEKQGVESLYTVLGVTDVHLGSTEAERIEYQFPKGDVSGLAYVIKGPSAFYVLTYAFGDLDDADTALADASADTFTTG